MRLMAPPFVKPDVKSNKNDVADAEAMGEAVARPSRRFVPFKNVEQQAMLALHRARRWFVKARTAQAHQSRGLLGEYGLILPQGLSGVVSGYSAAISAGGTARAAWRPPSLSAPATLTAPLPDSGHGLRNGGTSSRESSAASHSSALTREREPAAGRNFFEKLCNSGRPPFDQVRGENPTLNRIKADCMQVPVARYNVSHNSEPDAGCWPN